MKPNKQDIIEQIASLEESDRQIIEQVCAAYRITIEYLMSNRRYQDIVVPKQLLCFYFSQCGYNLTKIAKMLWTFGSDHTTVIHNRDKGRESIKRGEMMQMVYQMLPRPVMREAERMAAPCIFPMGYRPKAKVA